MKFKYRAKYIITEFIMNILKIYWIHPIDRNKILFISFDGKQYSDSPKYICEFLDETLPEKTLVWCFRFPEKFKHLENDGYKVIGRTMKELLPEITTAKAIVTNNFIPSYIPIRSSQILLNTWHGGSPLKTVGFAEANPSPYYKYFFSIQNKKYSAIISSSDFMTNEVFKKSFHFSGEILETGMPRNAILLGSHEKAIEKVYSYYGIEKTSDVAIVLYAPTFRGNFDNSTFIEDGQQFSIDDCIRWLNKKFNKKFKFLFRAHPSMNVNISDDNCLMATDYPDMQELLCAADVLITDYSSCMGDMALMQKPVFLYTPDLDDYIKDRGFYWDIYDLPFPIAKSPNELNSVISNFDNNEYRIGIRNYLTELGSFESNQSTNIVVDWLMNKI